MKEQFDLVGKRFGSVVVVKDDGNRSTDGGIKWCSYETIEKAKQARYEAEVKYFGEFAYDDGELR